MALPHDARKVIDHRSGSTDNFPGFEYLQRVSAATFRVLAAQGEQLNDAWADIRGGRFDFGMAMQLWAKAAESYFGVLTEVFRGPSETPRPAWLVVPYSKSEKRAPVFSVPIDGVIGSGVQLDYTQFESFGWDRRAVGDLYAEAPQGAGSRVHIRLNAETIQNVPDGTDLVSFVFRKGAGNSPPLVIVLLRVTG